MQLNWQIVTLQLKETFSISYGNYTHREALIISLSHYGFTGYGECTSIDYYGIDLNDLMNQLNLSKTLIESSKMLYPLEFYSFLLKLNLSSFLTSALDCAYWDLFGKLENKNFLELNKIRPNHLPDSSITISVASIDEQIEKIKKSNWSNFKVKCKGFDEKIIRRFSELEQSIALDSNGSFTEIDCGKLQQNIDSAQFTYIEQPMPIGYYSILNRNLHANWMADEDCQTIENLRSLQPHYKSVNIKLVKCGGLTPALELIKTARDLDFKIMIGCMTESTVGISAGAFLAPLADYADLDGANLIANDIADGSKIINGKIQLSEKPGLGISML
ncbi:chloromuconate cycloisomerase [Flavobacterium amniphilum]|uniref:enolase C-terminal domain-like protein n=1 Tax=Flavobacterium amniphilum TaxID=1834035 RepID=UPI00202A4C5D|nr:enolase C-terminal domain-like protein [Flavobacterium amniphilum]MCL9804325.1 chloromuconate cycloisomerase [Flavobacterium amniphilum]